MNISEQEQKFNVKIGDKVISSHFLYKGKMGIVQNAKAKERHLVPDDNYELSVCPFRQDGKLSQRRSISIMHNWKCCN